MTTQIPHHLERTVFIGGADLQGAGITMSGANLSCIFGSVKIDLRAASLAAQEVKLELFSLFGSVELRIPASWRVVIEVQPIFGSFGECADAAREQHGHLRQRRRAVLNALQPRPARNLKVP